MERRQCKFYDGQFRSVYLHRNHKRDEQIAGIHRLYHRQGQHPAGQCRHSRAQLLERGPVELAYLGDG